jgi:hypothetical protein
MTQTSISTPGEEERVDAARGEPWSDVIVGETQEDAILARSRKVADRPSSICGQSE